ncbi:unnamed protein product [Arctogadus glacialis]
MVKSRILVLIVIAPYANAELSLAHGQTSQHPRSPHTRHPSVVVVVVVVVEVVDVVGWQSGTGRALCWGGVGEAEGGASRRRRCINALQVRGERHSRSTTHRRQGNNVKSNYQETASGATMTKAILLVLLVLVAVCSTQGKPEQKNIPKRGKRIPQTLSRGWGDQLIWAQTYEEALYWSRWRNKPLLVIFHLEDCPHSALMKKAFADDKEVQKTLDEDFIVLNLMYETTDKHLSPDGQYVPRFLFVDPSMTVRADITGRYSNRMYAYEPVDMKLLLESMAKAKKLLKTEL